MTPPLRPNNVMQSRAALVLVAVLCALGWVQPRPVQAQSADALINKLVQKGVLSTQEADELRKETAQDFATASRARTAMPDWVTSLKFSGDLRLRYDYLAFDSPDFVDWQRFRYRLRAGVAAVLRDNFEVGFRLISSASTGNPLSGNQSFENNGSKKSINIDQAYAKWRPINNADWSVTLTAGKMENPLAVPDLPWDVDYTPEGLAQQIALNLGRQHTLRWTFGEFVLDELAFSSNDPYLFAAQMRLDSTWTRHLQTSLGVTALGIKNSASLVSSNLLDYNVGNTRTSAGPDGALVYHYNPIMVDASATWFLDAFPAFRGPFPIKVASQFMKNPAAPARNLAWSMGPTLGKAGRKGTWELSYRWRWIEGDAWYEEVIDDDTFGVYGADSIYGLAGVHSGPNLRSHLIAFTYAVFDSFSIGLKYSRMAAVGPIPPGYRSGAQRILVDAMWKF